ncbi:MAG: hypothetical protein IKT41_02130 [Clostridia bacterium]|nr:hypothetical protein [Clostridia bacterium]
MKKYILIIVTMSIMFLMILFILDLTNITQYIPFSKQYDWLGFVGTYIGSILGSAVTLFGVYETIKYEKEKDFEKNQLNNKPYFYNIDPYGKYDPKEVIEFILSEDASYNNKKKSKMLAIIKNTDNAILIVERILINNINYYPAMGEVIDKNQTACLEIYSNNDIELKDIKLYVKDIIGNLYTYSLEYNVKEDKIIQLKEI